MKSRVTKYLAVSIASALLLTWCALPASAAVDGTVVNRTTGQPQANVTVSLVQPGQGGMQTLESKKTGADGKFAFTKAAQGGGPQLVQAFYSAVIYTKALPPGAPSTDVQVDVYDSTQKPGTARLTQHFIILQPTGNELGVSDGYLFQGDPKLTFNDNKNGTLRFYMPPDAKGEPRVTVLAPGGMPIQRPAEKTKEANVYKVDYPLKPGETRFEVAYSLPGGEPLVFSGKDVLKPARTDIAVPSGVTLKADNVTVEGQEPKSQATIYSVKGSSYKVEVEGTGSLQSDGAAVSEEDTGQPGIHAITPRIYDKMYWIMGLAFAILALGSFLLFHSPSPKKN